MKGNSTLSPSSLLKTIDGSAVSENSSMKGNPANDAAEKGNKDAAERGGEDKNAKDSSEEGIKSIINFFKERIPEFQVKVLNVTRLEEVKLDAESLEQLVQEDEEKTASIDDWRMKLVIQIAFSMKHFQWVQVLIQLEGAKIKLQDSIWWSASKQRGCFIKIIYTCVLAEIKNMEKDTFIMHIPGRSTAGGNGI